MTICLPCVHVCPVISHLSTGDNMKDEEDFRHTMRYIFTDLPVQIWVVPPMGYQWPCKWDARLYLQNKLP